MAYDLLVTRIRERLAITGLSERKACLKAGVGLKTIYNVARLGHAPKPQNLTALARALGVPPSYFLDAAGLDDQPEPEVVLVRVHVTGEVQAGVWRDAVEWQRDLWYDVTVPGDGRYPNIVRTGLRVVGDSMDRIYPHGTTVVVVPFGELGRAPETGERVVVLQRSAAGYEATIKEYEKAGKDRHVLWPRSTNPDFQQPIVLTDQDLPMGNEGDLQASAPGLIISALVIGSYRAE